MPIRLFTVAALAAAVLSAPAALAQPVNDSFTYQGELIDSGEPASGFFDMEFRVYTDAIAGVVPPGASTSVSNVEVVDGLFSVEVDFGVSGFVFDTDDTRWLEIRVSEAGVPGTTILAPRQKLVPAPRANYALRAGFAQESGTTLDDAYNNGLGTGINAINGPVSIFNGLNNDAELWVGSSEPDNGTGYLTVYNETGAPTVRLSGNYTDGGAIILSENNANVFASLEPDFNGDGGFFSIRRDVGALGFFVDGNFDNSNSTAVNIFGTSPMEFNASETGDNSVQLPNSSVSSLEILNEPGVAEKQETFGTTPDPMISGAQIMSSVSINTPDSGFVLVIATAEVSVSHTSGSTSGCNFGLANGSTLIPSNGDVELRLSGSLPTGTYDFPVTVQAIFPRPRGSGPSTSSPTPQPAAGRSASSTSRSAPSTSPPRTAAPSVSRATTKARPSPTSSPPGQHP